MNIQPFTPVTTFKAGTVNGLDTSQKHQLQIGWNDTTAQAGWFSGHMSYTYENLTPLKFSGQTNMIKLPIVADLLQNCNYCMFLNANFNNNKWYYAFITNVRAISPNACEVNLKIDVYQTYYFNMIRHNCFISRQHVNDDTIGLNIVPEGVELGDYYVKHVANTSYNTNTKIVIGTTFKVKAGGDYEETAGGNYGNIYSGLYFSSYNPSGATNFINDVYDKNKQDGIVCIFEMPAQFITGLNVGPSLDTLTVGSKGNLRSGLFEGFSPKNNKLYTYPYCGLYVSNNQGNTAEMPLEEFSSDTITFKLGMNMGANPILFAFPNNFRGMTNNYDELMTLGGWPQCSWSGDVFKAYLAQNSGSLMLSALSTGISAAGQMLTGHVGMAITTEAMGVSNLLNQIHQNEMRPPQSRGNNAGDALYSYGLKEFDFYMKSIQHNYAKPIDDFFSMYGYAIKEIQSMNVFGRASWNYVETVNCVIGGSIPNDARIEIQSMFNRGLTLWHGDYIGDYSRANGII